MGAHVLGRRAERSVGPPAEAARRERPGQRVLDRLVQAQQRAGLPDAQVRVDVGHQQLRPPGAHLPLDHGGRRGQHVGVWCDDQLLQRHAELEGDLLHGVERRRGASGVAAAHPACEGERREDRRRRSALHAHRGQGRSLRAHPLGFRHRHPVRRAAPHLRERLGRQEVHRGPRLWHGQDPRRGDEVDRRQGRGSERRAG